jgi:hypothetical protein
MDKFIHRHPDAIVPSNTERPAADHPTDAPVVTQIFHEQISELESEQLGMYERSKNKIAKKWLRTNVNAFTLVDTIIDEYNTGISNSETARERNNIRLTTGVALAGQAYERARLPEILGVSIGTNVYRESMEQGHLSVVATTLGAASLGFFVYAQQKAIAKNWIKTTHHFPESYDTAKQIMPKLLDKVADALPDSDEPIKQGIAMVSLGTTPFIATARANNPEVDDAELTEIEKQVTRRGSIASAAMGVMVLGSLSLAPHVPEKTKLPVLDPRDVLRPIKLKEVGVPSWFPEKMVTYSDRLVDILSSPLYVAAALFSISGVATLSQKIANIESPKVEGV